jgi:transaldolase
MNANPLLTLRDLGQSVWLDDLDRPLIDSGELARLVAEDGVRGLTSNPSTFAKAIAGSDNYDAKIAALARAGRSVEEIYQELVVADVRDAADVLRAEFDRTGGRHGFASLEVDPHLAHDTRSTVAEARVLWRALDRPNVFIKVPATAEGLPAIAELIGEGINVNVTLLFGLPRYREVAEAYLQGLETLAQRGEDLSRVHSVASFFLSRIDVLVDQELAKVSGRQAAAARHLRGRVAIASARLAYGIYQEIFASDRFAALAAAGAHTQPLLWASTGTKDPAYPDTMYVEPLIGPDTINTMPPETLDAYRDHGQPALRLTDDAEAARDDLRALADAGIDLDHVTERLTDEGIDKFIQPFEKLMTRLREAQQAALAGRKLERSEEQA